MTDPLEKVFGNAARLRLLRLFLFNPAEQFTSRQAAERARVPSLLARGELAALAQGKLLRRGRGGRPRYSLNQDFPYLMPLQSLLLNAPARGDDLYRALRGAGLIKLVIIAGVFMGEQEGRLDLLVVGDRINEKKLRAALRKLESEIGRELRFAALATGDFLYRLNMNDKLVRDVMDYNHRVAYDKLDIGLK